MNSLIITLYLFCVCVFPSVLYLWRRVCAFRSIYATADREKMKTMRGMRSRILMKLSAYIRVQYFTTTFTDLGPIKIATRVGYKISILFSDFFVVEIKKIGGKQQCAFFALLLLLYVIAFNSNISVWVHDAWRMPRMHKHIWIVDLFNFAAVDRQLDGYVYTPHSRKSNSVSVALSTQPCAQRKLKSVAPSTRRWRCDLINSNRSI